MKPSPIITHEHDISKDEHIIKDDESLPFILDNQPPDITILERERISSASTKKDSRLGDILMVFLICLVFVLPLVLFTFVPPVRSIFRVIAEEFESLGGQGIFLNYVLVCGIGVVIIVFGLSPMLYDMILGYCFQSFLQAFLAIMIFRFIGIAATHGLSKLLLYDRIMTFYQSSGYFHAFRYLALKTPYKTQFIIRFAHIPLVMANYGIPLFGYTIWENLLVGMLSNAFFVSIYICFGLSARSVEELEQMDPSAGPNWMRFVPFLISVIGLVVIIYLFFASKEKIASVLNKYELAELKNRVAQKQFSSYGTLE